MDEKVDCEISGSGRCERQRVRTAECQHFEGYLLFGCFSVTKKVDRPPMDKSPFLRAIMNIMEKIQRDVEPKLKELTQDNPTGCKLSKVSKARDVE